MFLFVVQIKNSVKTKLNWLRAYMLSRIKRVVENATFNIVAPNTL